MAQCWTSAQCYSCLFTLLLLRLLLLQISGGENQVADACDANPACFSFDMEGSYGGYLKAAGAQEYTEGFNNYCKLGADQSCAGEQVQGLHGMYAASWWQQLTKSVTQQFCMVPCIMSVKLTCSTCLKF
jgi:hypothetical protein